MSVFFALERWLGRRKKNEGLSVRITRRQSPDGEIEEKFEADGAPAEVRAAANEFRSQASVGHAAQELGPQLPSKATQDRFLVRGRQLAAEARTMFETAAELFDSGEVEASEDAARKSLVIARSALDWLEDTELQEDAHHSMDQYGRWTREHFPERCSLTWTGSRYEERCPVALAHIRVGLSTGYLARRECSICGEDFSECAHEPGSEYPVVAGIRPDGLCTVCLMEECKDHAAGEIFNAEPISIVTDIEVEEVSLVARPKMPECRMLSQSVDVSELREALGEAFVPGVALQCSKCLQDCGGLHDPFVKGSSQPS